MSFDGAKVRRFLGLRKRFRDFVCDNSPFVDAGQRIGKIRIFLVFRLKLALIWIKIRIFAAQNIIYNKEWSKQRTNSSQPSTNCTQ